MTAIELGNSSPIEQSGTNAIRKLFLENPIASEEQLENAHIFLKRQTLARILSLYDIYAQILHVPGIILEAGVRWGGDLVTFTSLRGLLEPYNYARRIVGFDTFAGLAGVTETDQGPVTIQDGQFAVTSNFQSQLEMLLGAHESLAPLAHIKKHEIICGDARETVPRYLGDNEGTAIALLYLDMDIYDPTKQVLQACLPRMSQGSIIAFDEFGDRNFPGEAKAFFEVMKGQKYRLKRNIFSTVTAYCVLE